jgi:hypothetical protein
MGERRAVIRQAAGATARQARSAKGNGSMSSWHLPAITDGIAGRVQHLADAGLKARRGRQPVYDASMLKGRKEKNLKPFWA